MPPDLCKSVGCLCALFHEQVGIMKATNIDGGGLHPVTKCKGNLMDKNNPAKTPWFQMNEDWLALILAAVIILLASVGVLGGSGIVIPF